MKLKDIQFSPESLKAMGEYIKVRIDNVNFFTKRGSSPVTCVLAELVAVEAKLDALMKMMEDQDVLDFTHFDNEYKQACVIGKNTAESIKFQAVNR